jgi:Co/Zn/Cd efflux system component
MAECCCSPPLNLASPRGNQAYRRVVWAVLAINAVMFLVEIGAGLAASDQLRCRRTLSISLATPRTMRSSLFVVGMALRYRATAALLKAPPCGVRLWMLPTKGQSSARRMHGTLPSAFTMGTVGLAALCRQRRLVWLAWAYRSGDANMRSAWICTRNDAGQHRRVARLPWVCLVPARDGPTVTVAAIMAALALRGAAVVARQAAEELRRTPMSVAAE